MEIFKFVSDVVAVLANTLTVGTSTIVIYVFFAKKDEISNALKLLMNFSFQTTLSELKEKLERLNEYNASDPEDIAEIKNILHEIAGQFRGNSRLMRSSPKMPDRIEAATSNKKFSEPTKRSLVAELRETLKNLQANTYGSTQGVDHE